jgi:hypothetical protein
VSPAPAPAMSPFASPSSSPMATPERSPNPRAKTGTMRNTIAATEPISRSFGHRTAIDRGVMALTPRTLTTPTISAPKSPNPSPARRTSKNGASRTNRSRISHAALMNSHARQTPTPTDSPPRSAPASPTCQRGIQVGICHQRSSRIGPLGWVPILWASQPNQCVAWPCSLGSG